MPTYCVWKTYAASLSVNLCINCHKIEWNLIRLGGHAHGIVTKTVHKTLPGGVGANRVVWRIDS